MSCTENPYEYANKQNTVYDPETNTFLYGINNKMRVTGVGDGTCNQINPLIFQDNYKCGFGSAGGNPCRKVIESFNNDNDNESNNYKVTDTIKIILIVLIIILIIYILCNCSKEEKNNNNN
jgi:hypothetical protein